ncbi:MAG: peptidase S9 [Acidobacteriota bacterium]
MSLKNLGMVGTLWVLTMIGCAPAPEVAQYSARMVAVDPSGGGDATLSPDGEQFVISSKREGQWDLWMYDMPSAQWTRLTDHPEQDFEARWSPDGGELAFTSARGGFKNVWTLDLASGDLHQVTDSELEEDYPSWSPDGERIIYTGGPWGRRGFFVVPASGGEAVRISPREGQQGACTFDPRGGGVFCHSYDYGSGNLFRLALGASEIEPLTLGEPWDYKPSPTRDGRWIAFSRAAEGPSQIYVMATDGGRPRRLTHSGHDDRWPTWSADGKRLFFHRIVHRGTALSVLDRDSGEVEELVGADQEPLQASFAPDGRRVAFCSQQGAHKVIKILDRGLGTITPLATGDGEACYPRWSPDGEWIAFAARRERRWELARVRPDGRDLEDLTHGVVGLRGLDGVVDWSPDGGRLVFQGDTEPFEANLYLLDLASRSVTPLTDDSWFDESPSWSPEGDSVLFMSTRGGDWTWGFFEIELDGGGVSNFSSPEWVEKNFPRRGAHGRTVWSFYDEHDLEVLAEAAPGEEPRVLTAAGAGARWPSYSRDGRSILYTTVEKEVQYWLIENPFGEGSPLTSAEAGEPADQPMTPFQTAQGGRMSSSDHDGPVIGPVDLHHR